jgi:hypothetical protein
MVQNKKYIEEEKRESKKQEMEMIKLTQRKIK